MPPVWVMATVPVQSLKCEAYIFCELKQSPRWTLISHKDSLQCSGLLHFPFWATLDPFHQFIISKYTEMLQVNYRTKAMEFSLPAVWENNTPIQEEQNCHSSVGSKLEKQLSRKSPTQITWNKALSSCIAPLLSMTFLLSLILAKIYLLSPTAFLAKLLSPFQCYSLPF